MVAMPTAVKRLRSHWRCPFRPRRAPTGHQAVWHARFSFLVLAGIGTLARCAGGDNTSREEAVLGKRTMGMLRLGTVVAQVGVWYAWALLRPVRSSFGRSTGGLLACLMNGVTWIALVIWMEHAALAHSCKMCHLVVGLLYFCGLAAVIL